MVPPAASERARVPESEFRRDDDLRLTIRLVASALLIRLLSLTYSVYNYDESLYILMGLEMSRGHLPYTTVCDLKPFGLFAVFGLLTSLPFDSVVVSRLAASVVVGLSADLIRRIAALLFHDPVHAIGMAAGLAYIVFSLANGGMAAQGELFQNACSLLAVFVLVRALHHGNHNWIAFAVAGLFFGMGIQIKQSVAFDMAAMLVGLFLLRCAALYGTAPLPLSSVLRGALIGGLASLVPTLLVVALYSLSGHWDAWVAANVTAHQVFYGLSRPFEVDPALRAIWEQAPLWLMGLTAIALLNRLAWDHVERGSGAFLIVWTLSVGACMVFLRIASDHYFLQFLSPLSLLTGFLIGRGLLAAIETRAARKVALVLLTGLSLYAVAKEPLIHAGYIWWQRVAHGERHAGDTPRQIAADLKPQLRPGDTIYVIGFQPLIYALTGANSATRFAFTGLPHRDYPGRDGCPWVQQVVEMERVLASKPRFIVVEDGIFVHELNPTIKAKLNDVLARTYRRRKRYDQHYLHHLYPFERFVMNGGAAAEVYELDDEPKMTSL